MNKLMEQHLKYKDKTMDELVAERIEKLSIEQNELRKKYYQEKYNPNLSKKQS